MRLTSSLLMFFLLSIASANANPPIVAATEKRVGIASPQVDTLSIDTTGTQSMEKILGMKAGITIVSCVVEFARGGEISKTPYSPGNFSKIWTLICRTRPKDKVFFSNIFVNEGDKRYKLADRTFVIK